jgi:hypothetical protein
MEHSSQDLKIERPPYEPSRALLLFMRVGVPVAITAVGVVLVIMGHARYTSVFANRDSLYSALGVGFWLVAACVVLLNWLMRMNAEDAGDRAKEDDARAYFVRNGHWPGEGSDD